MNIKYLLIILLVASQSIFASEKQIDPKEDSEKFTLFSLSRSINF